MQKCIEIEETNIYFGKSHILKDVSCVFENRKITSLIGSSGCGKSTLIKSINRINELSKSYKFTGSIKYNGSDLFSVPILNLRQSIAMVFQRPVIFPYMSIVDNVLVGIRAKKKVKKRDSVEYAKQYLVQASLWKEIKNSIDRSPMSLSGGQQQRLCIARTLAQSPDVLLLDEPCSALDPASTLLIEDLLMNLKEKITIIVVTHNMQQAKRISDRVILILKEDDIGYIAESGAVDDIFYDPQNPLTKRFINAQLTG